MPFVDSIYETVIIINNFQKMVTQMQIIIKLFSNLLEYRTHLFLKVAHEGVFFIIYLN